MNVCELSFKQLQYLSKWMSMSSKQKHESLNERDSIVYFETDKTRERHGAVPCDSCSTGQDVMTVMDVGSFPTVYAVPECWSRGLDSTGHFYLHIDDVYPAMISGCNPDSMGDFLGKVEHFWVTSLEGWHSGR